MNNKIQNSLKVFAFKCIPKHSAFLLENPVSSISQKNTLKATLQIFA